MRFIKLRTIVAGGYPERFPIPEEKLPWSCGFPEYAPPYYVSPLVIAQDETVRAGGWADPEEISRRKRTDFISYSGKVVVDSGGYPLNPDGRTGISGRGTLGRWGANFAADPVITRIDPHTDLLQVIAITRKDSGNTAFPGGMVDPGEKISKTLTRELKEETGADVNLDDSTILFRGVVDDPRNTDNAWMETTAALVHLSSHEAAALTLVAGDDASKAWWLTISKNALHEMYASHGEILRMALRELLKRPEVLTVAVITQIQSALAR